MSDRPPRDDDTPTPDVADRAELTSPSGTAVPVDISRDLQARLTWVVLLAGPVIWATHFMVVYLVAEAGCTGTGDGLERLDPPVPAVVTGVATVLAVAACLAIGVWAWNRTAGRPAGEAATDPAATERHQSLAKVGGLLAGLSAIAILFVGAMAVWLPC